MCNLVCMNVCLYACTLSVSTHPDSHAEVEDAPQRKKNGHDLRGLTQSVTEVGVVETVRARLSVTFSSLFGVMSPYPTVKVRVEGGEGAGGGW